MCVHMYTHTHINTDICIHRCAHTHIDTHTNTQRGKCIHAHSTHREHGVWGLYFPPDWCLRAKCSKFLYIYFFSQRGSKQEFQMFLTWKHNDIATHTRTGTAISLQVLKPFLCSIHRHSHSSCSPPLLCHQAEECWDPDLLGKPHSCCHSSRLYNFPWLIHLCSEWIIQHLKRLI